MKQRNHDSKGVCFICRLLVASVHVHTSDVKIYKCTLDAFQRIYSIFHVATFLTEKMLPRHLRVTFIYIWLYFMQCVELHISWVMKVFVVSVATATWAGYVVRMGEGSVHRVLVGKPEGTRPLGRPRCRWEDNIKMDLQEVGGGHGDWMELAQDRDRWWALVGMVRDFRVP